MWHFSCLALSEIALRQEKIPPWRILLLKFPHLVLRTEKIPTQVILSMNGKILAMKKGGFLKTALCAS